jgi:hypothetical protein
MAQPTNTFETYDAVGNRETLADMIYMITPSKTPFMSAIGRKSVNGIKPEWQTDALATPSTSNNQPEGNEWEVDAIVATTRVGNYCQISEKSAVVSATQETVDKAGRASEMAREIRKKGQELKIDMEVTLLSNQASSAGSGNGATNRTLGGLRAWLATNDSLGAGGASGGYNTSTNVVDASTTGTQRAMTKALIDATMLSTANAGGEPDILMLSNYAKTVFSTFMSDANVATQRYVTPKNGPTTIVGAADMYLTDFGPLSVVPNVQMTRAGATIARNAYLLDVSLLKVGILRDINTTDVAKTGDNDKKVLNVEYTLVVNNEAGLGVVADIYGLSAST